MKMSEVDVFFIKQHLKIDDELEDLILAQYLEMAKKYILSYTGLTEIEADDKEDLSFATLALVSEFYENRTSTVSANTKPNPIIESILAMHSINYL